MHSESTALCHIHCHDDVDAAAAADGGGDEDGGRRQSVYVVAATVRGRLVELNDRLLYTPQLAAHKVSPRQGRT